MHFRSVCFQHTPQVAQVTCVSRGCHVAVTSAIAFFQPVTPWTVSALAPECCEKWRFHLISECRRWDTCISVKVNTEKKWNVSSRKCFTNVTTSLHSAVAHWQVYGKWIGCWHADIGQATSISRGETGHFWPRNVNPGKVVASSRRLTFMDTAVQNNCACAWRETTWQLPVSRGSETPLPLTENSAFWTSHFLVLSRGFTYAPASVLKAAVCGVCLQTWYSHQL
jgi:hypothetical protein